MPIRTLARALALALLARPSAAAPPQLDPWPVGEASYKVAALDSTDPSIWLVYATCNVSHCPKFPLVSYAHGFLGGDIDLLGYADFFYQIASFGFVIAAPDSCDVGCTDESQGAPWTDCAGVPPLGDWAPWYGEQLKAIAWARNMTANASSDPVFRTIDWEAGVAVAGHSMGGQATTLASSAGCAKQWGIKTAVLHHPETGTLPDGSNTGVNMSVPVVAFTSTGDRLCTPASVAGIMAAFNTSAQAATLPSAFVNAEGWSHLEPVLVPPIENPLLATYTAAWLKVFLNSDRGAYYDLTFGGGPDSLCLHANMSSCYITNAPPRA